MHGIVSLLDHRHAAQVAAVWASLQDRLGLQGMDVPPFPHVSYHVAEQYEVALVEPILRSFATSTAPLEVVTTGLGILTSGLQPALYVTVARHPGLSALQAAFRPQCGHQRVLSPRAVGAAYHTASWQPQCGRLGGGGALPASLGLYLAAASGQLDAAHERWRTPAAPRAVSVPPDGDTENGAGDGGDAGPRDASCPRPAVSQRGSIPVGGATQQEGARTAGHRAGGTSLRSTVSWLSYAAWCRGVC